MEIAALLDRRVDDSHHRRLTRRPFDLLLQKHDRPVRQHLHVPGFILWLPHCGSHTAVAVFLFLFTNTDRRGSTF